VLPLALGTALGSYLLLRPMPTNDSQAVSYATGRVVAPVGP
jgi:hypothetical protein